MKTNENTQVLFVFAKVMIQASVAGNNCFLLL